MLIGYSRLVANGADVHIQDNDGRIALTHAAIEGRETVIKLLLDNGADTNKKDANDLSPLDHARLKRNSGAAKPLQNYSSNSPNTYSSDDDEELFLPSNPIHNNQETARIASNPLGYNFNSTALLKFPSNLDNQDPIIIMVQDDDENAPPPWLPLDLSQ